MAKKLKPVAQECNQDFSAETTSSLSETSSSDKTPSVEVASTPQAFKINPGAYTTEEKAKLEQYDQVMQQNAILLKEKEELQEKIAEYLMELETLRSEKKCKKATTARDSKAEEELSKLRIEYKDLQTASDGYLMKISDLSFENAKLTAQLRELESAQSNNAAPAIAQTPAVHRLEHPAFNPYRHNGYESWN